MKSIYLEEREILEYIKSSLHDFKIEIKEIEDAKYHHNAKYEHTPLIINHGLLPISEQHKLGLINYTDKQLLLMSDSSSHVNGIEHISLSIQDLKDLSKKEWEYDSSVPYHVDLRISSSLKTYRDSTNYGNEFLHRGKINQEHIKAIDIRLLLYIEELERTSKRNESLEEIVKIVNKYNSLQEMAYNLQNSDLEIPLREVSESIPYILDINKVSESPKLILK